MAYYDDPLAVLQPGAIPQGGTAVPPPASLTASAPGFMDYVRHPLDSYRAWANQSAQPSGQFLNSAPMGTPGNPYQQPPAPPPAAPPSPPTPALAQPQQAPEAAPQPASPMSSAMAGPDAPAQTAPPPQAPATPASPVSTAMSDQQDLPVPPIPPAQPPAQAQQPATGAPAVDGDRYSPLLTGIFTAESGNNPSARNKHSSASGAGQLLDSTFQDFVNSPANTQKWTMADKDNTSAQMDAGRWNLSQNDKTISNAVGRPATTPEILTSWLVGGGGAAKLAANPDKPIDQLLTPDAIRYNPSVLKPGMTGAQAIASAAAFYGKGMTSNNQPSQPSGGTVAYNSVVGDSSRTPQIAAPTPQPAPNPPGLNDQDITSLVNGFKPSQSSQLMALASGFLGAPTFGRGLGAGLQNLSANDQQARQLAIQAANARAQMAYHTGMLGIGQQKANTGDVNAQTKIGGLVEKTADDQVKENQGQQRVDQGQAKIDQNDPVARARAAAAQAQAGKSNAQTDLIENGGTSKQAMDNKDEDTFVKSLDAARDSNRAAADVQTLLAKEGAAGLTGSDATSKVKRFLSTSLGMDVDGVSPSGIALAQKDLTQLQTKGVTSATNGSIPRSNAEYQAIASGLGSMGTNPEALKAIVQNTIDSNNRLLAAGTAWREMKPEDRMAAKKQYGGFSGWRDAFSAAQPANASMTGNTQPAPTIQPGSNGQWTHKDPTSGLGFTIH